MKDLNNFYKKHNHKDAILDVRCVTLEEFLEIIEINKNDPYLKCQSRQEQNLIDNLTERMVTDPLEESSKREDYCNAY